MVETHEIRAGARVTGGQGGRFGVVESIRSDQTSGAPHSFVIKTGFWPLQKRKLLSVDVIRQVNNTPDTIIVNVTKKEFRGAPAVKA